jgi:hypothetical protein
VLFVVGFLYGCYLSLRRHPVYGLLTYVATFYIEPTSQWWGKGFLSDIRVLMLSACVTLVSMMIHGRRLPRSPVFRSGAFWGFVAFVLWISAQSLWALDMQSHMEMLTIWCKFLLVAIMIGGCLDSMQHLRLFLWAHVLGCFYLGWTAWMFYSGGRFEGFGSTGLAEANAGALQLVTGGIVAGALFLAESWRLKAVLLVLAAFIANGVVTTMSRSGFLAAAAAAVVFNLFTPGRFRVRVWALTIAAAALTAIVTNQSYWTRMQTIELQGADIVGVDTGGGRLEIMQAQWKMFHDHPMGCGHMCTTVLSPDFLEKRFLAGGIARASHNTFMTMLVDHGVPGVILYVTLLLWIFVALRRVGRRLKGEEGFPAAVLPAIAAVLVAITVADLFVQYPKLEARVWFISALIAFDCLTAREAAAAKASRAPVPAGTATYAIDAPRSAPQPSGRVVTTRQGGAQG